MKKVARWYGHLLVMFVGSTIITDRLNNVILSEAKDL